MRAVPMPSSPTVPSANRRGGSSASNQLLRYAAGVLCIWIVVVIIKLPSSRNSQTEKDHAEAVQIQHNTVTSHKEADHKPIDPVPALHTYRPDSVLQEVEKEHPAENKKSMFAIPSDPTTAHPEPEEEHGGASHKGLSDRDGDSSGSFTNLDQVRRDEVVEALKHSWNGYKQYAFGWDEFAPISKRKSNWGGGRGIGSTIVDAVDTLLIAGLKDEANEALDWIENSLSFDQDAKVSVFETTIRVLGGLLSAYQHSGRAGVLDKAKDLGDRLMYAFKTPSGIPDNYVGLRSHHHEGAQWNGGAAILSELGSLQMEFYTLSKETGNPKYWKAARKAVEQIRGACGNGFCPRNFFGTRGSGGNAGFGSFGDSFYEYLVKVWILTGKKDDMFKEMFDKAAQHGIDSSTTRDGTFIINGVETGGVMEHLTCFTGGMYALSFIHTGNKDHLETGKKIAQTCHEMYEATATGLAYDVATMHGKGKWHASEPKYILRPETVETFFYLWKATHDPKYRDWGHAILKAINKHLRVEAGYVGALDTGRVPIRPNDNMETFWFAETLKYLYLLFSEDEAIDLHKWVINTEAHPLKVDGEWN